MPNLAVERSDAGTGSTPGLAQFRHPWAPPPGPKSDRVGAPGIARESVGFDSLTARGARWRSCALLHCWRPDCSIGHIFLPGAEQGGVRIETADRRYEVRTLDDGVVHIEEPHILPFYRCNIRLVHGRLRSLPVDSRHRRAPCAGSAYRRAGIGPGARGARRSPGSVLAPSLEGTRRGQASDDAPETVLCRAPRYVGRGLRGDPAPCKAVRRTGRDNPAWRR